jgi:alpha-tubulin suppressor-like RCC1 family protein
VGDGTGKSRLAPVRVPLPAPAVKIASGQDHSCAVLVDRSLWCWGSADWGQLGTEGDWGVGCTVHCKLGPVQVPGLGSDVDDVAAGSGTTCAIRKDGSLWCWGANDVGQLGAVGPAKVFSPTLVAGMDSDVMRVAAGDGVVCALKRDRALWCWGQNFGGQLGNASTSSSDIPLEVSGFAATVASVSIGWNQTCARTTDGGAWCWGTGSWGELGNGTFGAAFAPQPVLGTWP